MVNWEERLSEAGCKVTAPRRAVMNALQEAEKPLSPNEILSRGREDHPTLGLVTVYRSLELFSDLGMVRRVHRQGDCRGYMVSTPGHTHVVVCRRCGRAVEFQGGNDIRSLIERVEAETGYRVEGHLLQLFGVCPRYGDEEA